MPADSPEVLASFLDDCWEPDEAVGILHHQAPPPSRDLADTTALCLRVPGGDEDCAEVLGISGRIPDGESPGQAEYLWVLLTGPRPTRGFLLDLYREFRAARKPPGAG